MTDNFGRNIDYLRISVTDRCNLRCRYCMPKSGIENISASEMLTCEEIVEIVRIMSDIGIKKVRFTGGEPLLRKDISKIVKIIGDIPAIEETAITTNGILLSEMAEELKKSGISRVNVSLDTLDENVFDHITAADKLNDVLKGIDTAYDRGLGIKINCVPIKGINDGEICSMAMIAKNRNIDVRFIELMPMGCADSSNSVSNDDIFENLKDRFGVPKAECNCNASEPAKYFLFDGFFGRIGFISALSHKFCASCNRVRLTSEGFLKLCLQYPVGVNIKNAVRAGYSPNEIKELILDAVAEKPREHSFMDAKITDNRKMVQIGG